MASTPSASTRRRVFDVLRKSNTALTQTEIQSRTTLSRTTVAATLSAMKGRGLIKLDGERRDQPGPPQPMHRLDPDAAYIVGVVFGSRYLRVSAGNLNYDFVSHGDTRMLDGFPSPRTAPAAAALDEIAKQVNELFARGLDRRRVIGVGLGIPAPLRRQTAFAGRKRNAANPTRMVAVEGILPGWGDIDAAEELSRRLSGLPVAVENDANLGALGEAIKGAGQGHSLLLQVTAGYGIGCGIVHDGRIFGGAFGTAGELGHVIVNPHDERSDDDAGGCGMRGCLQAVAGGKAISDSVRGKVGKYLTLRRIIDEAEPGMGAKSDPVARACQEAVREASGHLGRTVAGICSILNPDCVVLSGGLSAAGTVALSPFRTALETYVLKCSIPSTVVATALGGPPRSELVGAWAHLLGSEHALARLEAEILGRDPE